MKKLLLILAISTLLIGCAFAANADDFKVDEKIYTSSFKDTDFTIYFEDTNTSGIGIFRSIETTDEDNDDAVDDILKTDGDDYLKADDDFKLEKNPDNTANFTDTENHNQGIVELVELDKEQFIIVFWSDNADDMSKLMTQLKDFNKDNSLTPVAF
ncbi:hypothetical protein [uncultured Methanobrevibacter sp.]|uniref:hypothetical protein n=1 Tax=uncultured Methanobrevibacter sp. TaxID=253161 RepID=UPI0026097A37|nr:hypothetical protein [uncultured Methanobrevibacter sp.]